MGLFDAVIHLLNNYNFLGISHVGFRKPTKRNSKCSTSSAAIDIVA